MSDRVNVDVNVVSSDSDIKCNGIQVYYVDNEGGQPVIKVEVDVSRSKKANRRTPVAQKPN